MDPTFAQRDTVESALKGHGLQATSQRVEVLRRLRASERHLSADDLYAELIGAKMKVSRATVYNTLNLLKEHGLVSEMVLDPGRVLFDPNTEPHYHFYDVDTHEITDVPADKVGFTCLPLLPEGATFKGVDVVVKISRRG
ncbi:MAG: Fur family transcriptional regulator [Cyanobacteria bacterium RYN_339]|nr:Fur family transcriptional regulator [Cyanobacteria bacterium RYN_339]